MRCPTDTFVPTFLPGMICLKCAAIGRPIALVMAVARSPQLVCLVVYTSQHISCAFSSWIGVSIMLPCSSANHLLICKKCPVEVLYALGECGSMYSPVFWVWVVRGRTVSSPLGLVGV